MKQGSEEIRTVREKFPDREFEEREGVCKSCPGEGEQVSGAIMRDQLLKP